jgi:protein subunit release factor B
VAVERCEVMTQLAEVEEAIDGAQQVTARHVLFEVEGVEELVLSAALLTHHRCAPSLRRAQHKRKRCLFFNKIAAQLTLAASRQTPAPGRVRLYGLRAGAAGFDHQADGHLGAFARSV